MAEYNQEKNDVKKIVMAGLTITLVINIFLVGFHGIQGQYDGEWVFNNNYINKMTSQEVGTITCPQGQESCTDQLINTGDEDSGQIDKTQTGYNAGTVLIKGALIIGFSTIFPIFLSNTISPMIDNSWILGILSIVLFIWNVTIIWAIIRFIFKR